MPDRVGRALCSQNAMQGNASKPDNSQGAFVYMYSGQEKQQQNAPHSHLGRGTAVMTCKKTNKNKAQIEFQNNKG